MWPFISVGVFNWNTVIEKFHYRHFPVCFSMVGNWHLLPLKRAPFGCTAVRGNVLKCHATVYRHTHSPNPQIFYQRPTFHERFTWHWHLRTADLNVNSALCVCSSSGQSGLQQKTRLLQWEKENKLFNWFYWQSSKCHHIYKFLWSCVMCIRWHILFWGFIFYLHWQHGSGWKCRPIGQSDLNISITQLCFVFSTH